MSKKRLVGIDCPILLALLGRKKKPLKWDKSRRIEQFPSLELEDVSLPQGIVGAVLVDEEDEHHFQSIINGEKEGWEGPDGRWMKSETIDTPAHGKVNIQLRWYPTFDTDCLDTLNSCGWVKSTLCSYVDGFTQVRAVADCGFEEPLQMDPENPPTSIQEGIEWIKLHHFGRRVLNSQGYPTGELPPAVYPKALGRHLVNVDDRWLILEVAKLEEPPTSPPEPDSSL